MLGYVGRWRSHEEVHTALDILDILLYNFTASYDGLQWTLYIEYVTVSDIIVIYCIRHCYRPLEFNLELKLWTVLGINHQYCGSAKVLSVYFKHRNTVFLEMHILSLFSGYQHSRCTQLEDCICCFGCVVLGLYMLDQWNCPFWKGKLVSYSIYIYIYIYIYAMHFSQFSTLWRLRIYK